MLWCGWRRWSWLLCRWLSCGRRWAATNFLLELHDALVQFTLLTPVLVFRLLTKLAIQRDHTLQARNGKVVLQPLLFVLVDQKSGHKLFGVFLLLGGFADKVVELVLYGVSLAMLLCCGFRAAHGLSQETREVVALLGSSLPVGGC